MYTSDTEKRRVDRRIDFTKNQLKKHLIVSLVVLVFGIGYEMFSHGVISLFMLLAFLIPLLLGVVPYLVLSVFGKSGFLNRTSAQLWNSAVYIFTMGSLMQGALQIYGTTNSLTILYPILGLLFVAASLMVQRYKRTVG